MTKPEKVACQNPKEICAQNRKSGLTKHTLLPYEWGGAEDPDAEACEDAVMGLYGGAETYTLEEVRERLGL